MEEVNGKVDLHKNSGRKLSVRTSGSSKSTSLLGRSSPRISSYQRSNSSRTPPIRRESKPELHWIRNNRVFLWLLLIAVWAYAGFHVQSIWVHRNKHKEDLNIFDSEVDHPSKVEVPKTISEYLRTNGTSSSGVKPAETGVKDLDADKLDAKLGRKSSRKNTSVMNSSRRFKRRIRAEDSSNNIENEMIFRKNTSYGLLVGPFSKTEDNILGWSPEKRTGTCDRKGDFAQIVWSRSFVLIFHELSMTGAPISMMELATELLSCGATVSAVVLINKGGLQSELDRRGIKVLKDRAQSSFKAAMKADLVIAGSAVCSSWIDQYLKHFPAGSSKIVWWIMENRREYFERSKHLITRVKMLTFLSNAQLAKWLSWSEEEKINLGLQPMVVPLSVNDELAFVAGIPCSLNTPAFSAEKMLEKKNLLRAAVRKEMGLSETDMLVMSLSSINPTKGQLFFFESALLVAENIVSLKSFGKNGLHEVSEVAHRNDSILTMEAKPGVISHEELKPEGVSSYNKHKSLEIPHKALRPDDDSSEDKYQSDAIRITSEKKRNRRRLLSEGDGHQQQGLKILVGSVGSKSNKVLYVKAILRFLSQHTNLSSRVFWTPATTRVASLYAAADVFVINAQGLGETFGRVTIEAMAFGMPVLGTDAGGTQEIVEHNVTGLLHPVGRHGVETLARNIHYLLSNSSAKDEMGVLGRKKVQEKYMKNNTYQRLAKVLLKCMKVK